MKLLMWFYGIALYLWHNPILLGTLIFLSIWMLLICVIGFQRPAWLWQMLWGRAMGPNEIIKQINEERKARR